MCILECMKVAEYNIIGIVYIYYYSSYQSPSFGLILSYINMINSQIYFFIKKNCNYICIRYNGFRI